MKQDNASPKFAYILPTFVTSRALRDRPETATKPARDYLLPFDLASPSLADCNSSWKIYVQTHLSKNVYAFCTCWFLSLICPLPLSQLCLFPSPLTLPPPSLPPSSVAFILSFCEHLACSFGFFGQLSGGHAQQSVMKFLGF